MTQKKALVTGATGYIGSRLVRGLLRNNWEVHCIARKNSSVNYLQDVLHRITIYSHDGSSKNMLEIMSKAMPRTVFHLASCVRVEHDEGDILPLIESNLLFGTQLVEAMVKTEVFQLINTGTSWQHYENEAYNPVCLYAATKQAFESIMKYYVEATPLKAINLKLYDTYGPDDGRNKLFTLLRYALKSGQPLNLSPGEQLVNIVYIDDVIEGYLQAEMRLKRTTSNIEEFALGAKSLIKLKELVRVYSQVMDVEPPIVWGGRAYRRREVMVPWSTGRILPDWEPQIDLETGIKRMEQMERK